MNLFLRMEDETSHQRLVHALNLKFSNLGWNTWATYARSTVPFTGQPTWLSGDARCRGRRCDYEAVSYPDWEPHHPRTSDQLAATNTAASVPMKEHSSTHAPVAVAYSSIRRSNPLSDDEGEETLQLHATESLETDDLVDLADLPPLEDLDTSSSQASSHDLSFSQATSQDFTTPEHLLNLPVPALTTPTLDAVHTSHDPLNTTSDHNTENRASREKCVERSNTMGHPPHTTTEEPRRRTTTGEPRGRTTTHRPRHKGEQLQMAERHPPTGDPKCGTGTNRD